MSKPLNSFILYCKDFRPIFQAQYPFHSNAEITSFLGTDWRSRDASFKAPYQRKSAAMTKVCFLHFLIFAIIYLNNLSSQAYKSVEKCRKPKTKISENQFRFSLHKTETPCQPKKSTVVEVKKPNVNRKKNLNWDLCVQRFSTVFQENDTLGNIWDELLLHHNRTILQNM